MAKNALSGIEALASEVAEARAILAQKSELDAAIAKAEKRLDHVRAELAEKEHAIEQADSQFKDVNSRFEHEKRRYSLDLDAHKSKCAEAKKAASAEADSLLGQLNADRHAYAEKCATEKRALGSELEKLRSARDHIRVEISDLKRRIAVLE